MDDSLSHVHTLLGDIYLFQGQHDEALIEWEKAVSLDPNNAEAYWFLGRAFLFSGQPDKAIPLLKKAMRLHPYYPWYYLAPLARAYYHSGRYDDALGTVERILRICKEGKCSLKWPYLYLSMIYVELGQIEEARAYMEKVLENDPRFNIKDRRTRNLYKDQTLNERELAAHRKAGAPEQPPSK